MAPAGGWDPPLTPAAAGMAPLSKERALAKISTPSRAHVQARIEPAPDWRARACLWMAIGFLLLCLLGGGSNRATVLSLLYLRPAAVLYIAALLIVGRPFAWPMVQVPLLLLVGVIVLALAQLVPLPPAWWAALPLRDALATSEAATGATPVWRPMTISPDLTVNALLAATIPLAMLLGLASLDGRQLRQLILALIVAAFASAILGMIQFAGGANSPAYLYAEHLEALPDGFFANRNHQAVFLAIGILLLSIWPRCFDRHRLSGRVVLLITAAGAMLLLAVAVATGSRSGTLLAVAATLYTLATSGAGQIVQGRHARWLRIAALVAPLLVTMVLVVFGRAVALDRLTGLSIDTEQRFKSMPVMLDMARSLYPLGSGLGTFDPAYRMVEPDALLHLSFFNHAHDDWLEALLTGGIPMILLVTGFVVWWGARTVGAFRRSPRGSGAIARASALAILVLGLASITDYPLRTPLMGAVIAVLAAALGTFGAPAAGRLPVVSPAHPS